MRNSLTIFLSLLFLIFSSGCAVVEAPFAVVNTALELPLAAAQSVVNAPGEAVNELVGDPRGRRQREAIAESRRKQISHDQMLKERTERKKAEWALRGDSPVPEDRPTYVRPRRVPGAGTAVSLSPAFQAGER